jgi:hypothetical protein
MSALLTVPIFRSVSTKTSEFLQSMLAMLPVKDVVDALKSTIDNGDAALREQGLLCLNEYVARAASRLTAEQVAVVSSLVPHLTGLLAGPDSRSEGVKSMQLSLLSLEVVTRHLGAKKPTDYVAIVPKIIDTCLSAQVSDHVVASALVTMASLWYVLKWFPMSVTVAPLKSDGLKYLTTFSSALHSVFILFRSCQRLFL